jgi:hypothetical protein
MSAFLIYSSADNGSCVVVLGDSDRHILGENPSNEGYSDFSLLRSVPLNGGLEELARMLPLESKTNCSIETTDLWRVIRESVILGWNTGSDIWKKSRPINDQLFSDLIRKPKVPQIVRETKSKAEAFGFSFNKESQSLTVGQIKLMLIACFQASLILSRDGQYHVVS